MSEAVFIESDTAELKECWAAAALSDLAAFANTRGGTLYLGVSDSGRVIGCDVDDAVQQSVANKIRNILSVTPEIRVETHGDRSVLAVAVRPSKTPVLLRGSYWARMGTVSTKISPDQWAGLVLKQIGKTWDGLPAQNPVAAESIDRVAVAEYIRRAKAHPQPRLPADLPETAPVEVVLGSLGLVPDGEISNAAVLAFGTNPYESFRNARIRVARFRGPGVDNISEHPLIAGTALRQIDCAVEVLEQYIPYRFLMPGTAGNLDEVIRRRDLAEYPVSVVREAVTNAVIHRDYISPDDIQIRIFDDRFEIWNPGSLLPDLTIADLYTAPHESKRRNPLLADVAFFVHAIERWGTGTSRMLKACAEAGFPRPEFEERTGGFLVILRRDRWADEVLRKCGLSERQLQAIPELRANGQLTVQLYRRITRASRRTALRDLRGMVACGLMEPVGAGRIARYVLKRAAEPTNAE